MIAFSRLLCGYASVSGVMRGKASGQVVPEVHQFSFTEPPLLVAWNATYRCNLSCSHCHIDADDRCAGDELTEVEARAMIDDLAEMRVPVLLFSGGEPLVREDVLDLARYASAKGLQPLLSTNGTLIDRQMAERIHSAEVHYAGISIDGLEATHNQFRRNSRAFQDAVEGISNCNEAGVKAGIRFTPNALSNHDLPGVLDLAEELKVSRFCMHNSTCSGPKSVLKNQGVTPEEWRNAVSFLIEKAMDWDRRGIQIEIITTDQHAEGAYVHSYVTRTLPDHAEGVRRLLEMSGGCSASCKMSNVDPAGNVHVCQFRGQVTLGNVRKRKFSEIWRDPDSAALEQLRRKHGLVPEEACAAHSERRL